ncbi:MAG: thioredoxin family protein [Alistipes sp.]|jgi:thiol:disulfide interchange protein DsbD|nr:thioredoxin family protein [Alistipes sp.]
MKKLLLSSLLFVISVAGVRAQEPATWSFQLSDKGGGEVELAATVQIAPTWHVFDLTIPDGGPVPTTLEIDRLEGAVAVGKFHVAGATLKTKYDDIFEMTYGYYEGRATFVQRFRVTDKAAFALAGDLRGQVCSEIDGQCIQVKEAFEYTSKNLPATFTAAAKATSGVGEKAPAGEAVAPAATTGAARDAAPSNETVPAEESGAAETPTKAASLAPVSQSELWRPVIEEVKAYGAAGDTSDMSLLWIFLGGFGGGLLALLTPCVWPMIPMTVSFFLKRNKKRGKAISEAMTYGLGIILIYVALGLLITGVFGASALNDLATSAIFNLIFFALLVVFAVSFFGAFELVLPASWTNKMDSKADSTTGIISIFFMAFTLALVSFSCTGPIIGTLLVQAAGSGSIVAPAVGMLGFALALAIPFSLFAIFPSWLESMPASGGWLNSVKVVLGFLELALALKFLSVADLAYGWGILDREVFLVLWIVIFALMGLYLLGKLRLPHDSELKHVSVPRLFLAIVSFSFAVYMVPGLWGAPLKSISAFSPPLFTQDFSLYKGEVHAAFDDYEAGMEYARKNDKPVMIDFSGYGCVNCRKMEASVWTDVRVKDRLENDYVLITLMVDDKTALPEVIEVEENGKTSRLKTVGDKWSYLQRHKFGTNSQPYYVLLDNAGNPIGPSYAYDENVTKYLDFLNKGLENFEARGL